MNQAALDGVASGKGNPGTGRRKRTGFAHTAREGSILL